MSALADLVFTIAISLVPSLMFLGLWHGLMYLRDDDLVESAREMERQRPRYSRGATPGSGSGSGGRASRPGDDAMVVCRRCSKPNTAGVTYCWNCLAELPD